MFLQSKKELNEVKLLYLTIAEIAEYINLPVHEIERLIREGQIRYVYFEEEVLINRDQFKLFLKEREKYKEEWADFLREPIPEDVDIKDED